ncbi:MAG: hypothetical protein GY917_30490, partial [Planctomycetaceae bacterium]|nr:hypothetical protein [Planctomycetaceae bacterium]
LAALALNPNLADRFDLNAIRGDLGRPTSAVAQSIGQVAWAKAHLALNERVAAGESGHTGFEQAAQSEYLCPENWFHSDADWSTRGTQPMDEATWISTLEAVAAGQDSYAKVADWLLPVDVNYAWPQVAVEARVRPELGSLDYHAADASEDGSVVAVRFLRFNGQGLRVQQAVGYFISTLFPVIGDDPVKWESALAILDQLADDSDRSVKDAVQTVKRLNAASQA